MTRYGQKDLITESLYSILKVIAENNQILDLNLLKYGLENALDNLHMNDEIINIIENNKLKIQAIQNDFLEMEEDTKILFPTPFDEIITTMHNLENGLNYKPLLSPPEAPTDPLGFITTIIPPKDSEDLLNWDIEIPTKMYTKFTFNDGQQIIFNFMKRIMESDKRVFAINGPAGTGKTTLVNCILNYFYEELSIASTAPTHKAVEVIKGKILEFDMNPDDDSGYGKSTLKVGTIHSFLKLKKSTQYEGDEEGKVQFVPDNNPKLKSLKVDLLFVDESSMISNQIRKMINLLLKQRLSEQIII